MPALFIGSDHAGFALKEVLIAHLREQGATVTDLGTHSAESTDYPNYAKPVCEAVLAHNGLGILICGTGVGMSMAANRIPGIRAALCAYEFQARACREHNDANILCLGERVTGPGLAITMLDAFLETPFAGGRHSRRIALFDPAADEYSPQID